jgi:hypothetical protein
VRHSRAIDFKTYPSVCDVYQHHTCRASTWARIVNFIIDENRDIIAADSHGSSTGWTSIFGSSNNRQRPITAQASTPSPPTINGCRDVGGK